MPKVDKPPVTVIFGTSSVLPWPRFDEQSSFRVPQSVTPKLVISNTPTDVPNRGTAGMT